MRYKPLAFVMCSFLFLGASPGWPQLKKIRLSAPTLAITEVPFKIAKAKGFYREEGLDVEVILIRGAMAGSSWCLLRFLTLVWRCRII